MIVLSGADLVLPDRILSPGTLVIDGDRIVDVRAGGTLAGQWPAGFAFQGHYILPGFIDIHVHGVDGVDTLDEGDPVAAMAARLPRYGVTAFCPTTIACAPVDLRRVFDGVRRARRTPHARAARVLPVHVESNFISPEYRGAQPARCLRSPRQALDGWSSGRGGWQGRGAAAQQDKDATRGAGERGHGFASGEGSRSEEDFDAADVLIEIQRAAPDVGIVTLAPEIEGALELTRWLCSRGHRVSLGHSAATYEQGLAAIAAGARHSTHLFNRMPPLHHRSPGLVGAILQADLVAAELICDGFHLHPAIVRTAVATKGPSRVLAITDGTAASGLPPGSRARLGGQPLTGGEFAAFLSDGTLAGSIATMDRVFRTLVGPIGLSFVDAATLCSTTAAREMGLVGHGVLAPEAVADVVVLDAQLSVVQTYVGGELAYTRHVPAEI